MGASDFMAEGRGKTATEAFRAAVDQAAYEYGHGGYSGSIAEKRNFVMIKDTPEQVAARYAKELEAYPRILKQLQNGDVRAVAEALIELFDKRIEDKWGPAGCIDMGQ